MKLDNDVVRVLNNDGIGDINWEMMKKYENDTNKYVNHNQITQITHISK